MLKYTENKGKIYGKNPHLNKVKITVEITVKYKYNKYILAGFYKKYQGTVILPEVYGEII